MYTLLRPSEERMARLAEEARALPLSTPKDPLKEAPERSWNVDHYEVSVDIPRSVSPEAVHRAVSAIISGVEFFPPWMIALRRGPIVVVGARAFGILGTFADRIISEHDTGDDALGTFQVGFTYATVAGHFETGVESFSAAREGKEAPVRFSIDAISLAEGLVKSAISLIAARRLQRRFGHDTPLVFAERLKARLRG